MEKIIAFLRKLFGILEPEPAPVPKPTDIIADTIAAKIIVECDKVVYTNDWEAPNMAVEICTWESGGITASHKVRHCADLRFNLRAVEDECIVGVNGKAVVMEKSNAEKITGAMKEAIRLVAERKKAQVEADNQFNALDAIAEVLNIGNPDVQNNG